MQRKKKQLSIRFIKPEKVQLIVIDSFCGAGGFTEGVENAVDDQGDRLAVVIVGINHDALAIESHAINHPETEHFVEDIRDKTLPHRILRILIQARIKYPNAKVLFHASLECTNFSNAKGGKTRDPDSRSLAEFMPWYLEVLNPDLFTVENVREFLAWGPMTAKRGKTTEGWEFSHLVPVYEGKGKKKRIVCFKPHLVPIKEYKGLYFEHWKGKILKNGYRYEHRLHNTADFGVNQARTRLFAVFAREDCPIAWPQQSHARAPKTLPSGRILQKWRPIRECLNLDQKGKSIFRDPPLSDKTYERIFEGLVRHVGNGDREFISKYFTGEGMNFGLDNPAHTLTSVDHHSLIQCSPFMVQLFGANSLGHNTYPADRPSKTITTQDGHALVSPEFVMTYHSGSPENRVKSLDDPAQTLTTENRIARVFCMKYHGTGQNTFDTTDPCSTLTLKDRVAVLESHFVDLQYSEGQRSQAVTEPAGCLTTVPKHKLVSAEFIDRQYGQSKPSGIEDPAACLTVNPHLALVQAFLINPSWFGHSKDIDSPSATIVACQHKSPLSVVQAVGVQQWILQNQFEHKGKSLDEPSPTILTTGTHHYLMSTNFQNVRSDLGKPSPTLTADRHWHYIVTAEHGVQPAIIVYPTDSLPVRKIKAFMAEYGIVDILMRMLMVDELKRIQGFPSYYILRGSQSHQKKFIGNSVPPLYVQKWMESLALAVRDMKPELEAVA